MSETDSEKKIKRRARETKEKPDGSSASGIRKAGDTDLGLSFSTPFQIRASSSEGVNAITLLFEKSFTFLVMI